MKSKYMKALIPVTIVLLFTISIFWGCGEPGFTGEKPVNSAPKCYLANIPVEGTKYSANPVLYWFATDEDGYIKEYRYVVKKADDISDDPLSFATDAVQNDNYDGWNVIDVGDDPNQSANSDTIQFYANLDPDIYTKQYFFVQAIDNHGAVSSLTDTVSESGQQKISILSYRMFYRNNHAPNTHMTFQDSILYYSLDTLSESYDGIPIVWEGSDSLDYKRAQPKFEYHWQLFGPFETIDDTSSTDMSMLVRESKDTTTNSVWVEDESTVLYNLYEKAPASSVTRTEWFVFKVVCRDDAFVSDSTPEIAAFRAVEPKFEKGILLIDNNNYSPGSNMLLHAISIKDFGADDPNVLNYQEYYKSLFKEASYPVDDLYFYLDPNSPFDKRVPSEDTLVKYKLVVMVNDNYFNANSDETHWDPLANYMDVGGKVMLIGWNSFSGPNFSREPISYGEYTFVGKYFGIHEEYCTNWKLKENTSAPRDQWWGPDNGVTNEELIRADAIVSDLPPQLTVDGEHLDEYFISSRLWIAETDTIEYNGRKIGYQVKNNYPFNQDAEPWVNYYVKFPSAEALYIAISLYKNPRDFFFSSTSIDGKPIAVRKKAGLYKTAVLGFSIYCRPKDEAVELIQSMMDWFFKE